MLERVKRMRDALEVGERVVIRGVRRSDGDEFLGLMRASSELHGPWSFPPTRPTEFEALVDRTRSDDFLMLVVVRRSDDAIVGFVNISQIFRGAFQNAHLGYAVGSPYARQGYMTEALELVLRHAFGKLRLHRVEVNIQPSNVASLALARRAGFRLEGFSPRYLKIDGEWRDHQRWAIVAEEFEDRQAGLRK